MSISQANLQVQSETVGMGTHVCKFRFSNRTNNAVAFNNLLSLSDNNGESETYSDILYEEKRETYFIWLAYDPNNA